MAEEALGLTVYLLRHDQVEAFQQQFRVEDSVALRPGLEGRFHPFLPRPSTPRWVEAMREVLADGSSLLLETQSPAGLLVLPRGGRTFVVTFGHAWQKLQQEWLEPDFGRRVALNLLRVDELVEIRFEQVFAKWHVSTDRAPRASAVDEFGVDFDRDLVGVVEGAPSKDLAGRSVRGGTSLRVQLALPRLLDFLETAEDLFKSKAYRKRWPDIDNLTPVRDQAVLEQLEIQLDREMASGAAERSVVMFTPTYRREEPFVAESYVFGRLTDSAPRTPYLLYSAWTARLDRLGLSPSVSEAKRDPLHMLDSQNGSKRVSVFDCLGYETAHRGRQYILASGVWFEVSSDFLARVDKAARDIGKPGIHLPPWDGVEKEPAYNKRLAEGPGFLAFDAKLVQFGGGASKVEFCDALHLPSRTLIFAKIYSKSAGMSHLVEQVRTTAELLFAPDDAYRKTLRQVFRKHHPTVDRAWLDAKPRPGDWSFCLVSLGRSPVDLPFMARRAIVKLVQDLRGRGHDVSCGAVWPSSARVPCGR